MFWFNSLASVIIPPSIDGIADLDDLSGRALKFTHLVLANCSDCKFKGNQLISVSCLTFVSSHLLGHSHIQCWQTCRCPCKDLGRYCCWRWKSRSAWSCTYVKGKYVSRALPSPYFVLLSALSHFLCSTALTFLAQAWVGFISYESTG